MEEDPKNRIIEKIEEIEEYLSKLLDIVPEDLESYQLDYEKKWSCEMGFQKVIEAVTDLTFLIITNKDLEVAEDDLNAFDILEKNKIASKELSVKLKEARGMRNFIIHEYGKIDDEKVFHAISEEIEKDINDFIDSIKRCIK